MCRLTVLTRVLSSVLWSVESQHFGGTCCLLLQGRRVGEARNQQKQSAVVSSFRVVTPWSFVGARSLGGTYRLHLQGRRRNQAKSLPEAGSSKASAIFAPSFVLLRPASSIACGICPHPVATCVMRASWLVYSSMSKKEATCSSETSVNCVISQKIELFITTALRTSDPAYCSCNFRMSCG
jgi:hypothetical protein